ncbi:MAG: VTT domain-containing protein [Methylococcales bacterium]|nr:VTT domain-containing protein [Methylococcales bacterium]
MFQKLYDKTLRWSRHRHAPYYLGFVSFADSSFFPLTPLVMLAPMVLAQRDKAFQFALLTTLMSALGGIFGYGIGYFLFEMISPWLQTTHYWNDYLAAKTEVDKWGIWAVLIGGFLPIPYKVFTITAGSLNVALLPFVLVSTIGRGSRFFLIAFLLKSSSKKLETKLRDYINKIGWVSVATIVISVSVYQFLKN